MKKSLAWYFVPPIALSARRRVINRIKKGPLFDGDDALFKDLASQSEIYGEYGCGSSTEWVFSHCRSSIYSVESSSEWASLITKKVGSSRLELEWIDLGDVEDWGWPASYRMRANFEQYVNSIWRRSSSPDLVLIDGRFRVACFLASLLNGQPGTRIIFDDYRHRGRYHIVEDFIKPNEFCGRQASFVIPDNIDREYVSDTLKKFEYVIE